MTDADIDKNWYKDDQFLRQMGELNGREVVANRWKIFKQALEPLLNSENPIKLLDAGCGDGINLLELDRILYEHNPKNLIMGMDLNPVRVARAKNRASGPVLQGSLTNLPFAEEEFDAVLCSHVIEHIPNPELAIDEIVRILKPGGVAIVGVPNEGCLLALLRNQVLQRSILRSTDHVNFFTRSILESLLLNAGLSVNEILTEGFFLPHLRLSNLVSRASLGRKFLKVLGQLFPSQAAGLIAVGRRT